MRAMRILLRHKNVLNGSDPDGTGGILQINQHGKALIPGIIGNKFPLNLYYSYGMWNSSTTICLLIILVA